MKLGFPAQLIFDDIYAFSILKNHMKNEDEIYAFSIYANL